MNLRFSIDIIHSSSSQPNLDLFHDLNITLKQHKKCEKNRELTKPYLGKGNNPLLYKTILFHAFVFKTSHKHVTWINKKKRTYMSSS